MPDPNEIGAKVVLSGDATGAVKATSEAAQGVSQFVKEVTAGDRAVAQLDKELRALSPEKLHEVGAALEKSIGNAKGGENVEEYRQRLAQIRNLQAEHAAAGAVSQSGAHSHGEEGFEHLKESLAELAQVIPGASGAISAFGGIAEAAGAGPLAALGLGVVALTAGVEGLKHGVEEFAQTQVANTKLDQALAQAGQLTDEYREKLQKLSQELQESTGIADERWAAVLARLTQFGADPSNIEEYAEAVKNLAGLMGGDIESAGRLFSRAMNGNVTALSRLGIQVDKTATSHEKLEQIMAQLAQRGGGQLAVQTATITGQFITLANSTADLFKGIGNLISRTGVLQTTLEAASKTLNFFAEFFPDTVKKVEGLTNKLPTAGKVFDDLGDAAEGAGGQMGGMGTSADGAIDGVERLSAEADTAKKAFEGAATAAKELRERQDALAEANVAIKLADVNLREQQQKVTPQDAAKQRASIRSQAEQDKYQRQIKEQDTIIGSANERIGKAGAEAGAARNTATLSKAEVDRIKAEIMHEFGGFRDVDKVDAASIQPGINPFSVLAEAARAQAQEQRLIAGESGGGRHTVPMEDFKAAPARAEQFEKEAAAYEKLAAAVSVATKARLADAAAAKELEAIQKDAGKEVDKARAAQTVARRQATAAGYNAQAEETRRERETTIKDLEAQQKVLEKAIRTTTDSARKGDLQKLFEKNADQINTLTNGGDPVARERGKYLEPSAPVGEASKKYNEEQIKTIDLALKADADLRKKLEEAGKNAGSDESKALRSFTADQLKARGLLTPGERAGAERRRSELEEANAADVERTDAPKVRAQEDFNRHSEQNERFGQAVGANGTGGQIVALGERARGIVEKVGPGTPGSSTEAAVKLIEQLVARMEKEGGANPNTDVSLARALESLTQTVGGRLQDTASKAEVARVVRQVENLASQIRNMR